MSKPKLFLAAALAATFAILPARGADTEGKATARHAAHEKEGERHEPAEGTQQHKMKTCNSEAGKKQLKGEERRAFMSACLKG